MPIKQVVIKLDVFNGNSHWDDIAEVETAIAELLQQAVDKIRSGQFHTVPNQKTSSFKIYDVNGQPTGSVYVVRKGKS